MTKQTTQSEISRIVSAIDQAIVDLGILGRCEDTPYEIASELDLCSGPAVRLQLVSEQLQELDLLGVDA